MSHKFSIYDSPLSDETKILRRNSLILSGLCLFIGLTGELPTKFALLGVSFNTSQQSTIALFILAILIYFFLHFISMAAVEVAKWIHPFFRGIMMKKTLLDEFPHAFDEEDFINIPDQVDEHNKNDMQAYAAEHADWKVTKNLRWLYSLIYLKLTIEILVPVGIGVWSIVLMTMLITSP